MYKIINWYTKHLHFPHRGWKYFKTILIRLGLYNHTYIKKIHTGNYLYLRPSEFIQQQIFWYGYYEKEAVITWEAFITAGSNVMDIGANIGYYSVVAASKGAQVYSFEPATKTANAFKENILLNKFKNVHFFQVALSSHNKQQNLYLSQPDNSGMTSLAAPEDFSGLIEMVNTLTLDEWFALHNPTSVDCIKIDVEGAEMEVLKGASGVLEKYQPVVFIEIINELLQKFGSGYIEMYLFFESMGYQAYEISAPKKLRRLLKPTEDYTIVFIPPGFKWPNAIAVEGE